MNKTFKIVLGASTAFFLVAGITADAKMGAMSAYYENDSTVASSQKNTVMPNETSVVDEVIWVVGDEPILKSDVEYMRLQAESEGIKWNGDPDCLIPEQLAVQKLYLHQASLDSIEVTETEVMQDVDMQINYLIQRAGSREKLEEYSNKTISQMRQSMHEDFKTRLLIRKMQQKLVGDITVSPAEVRKYFKDMPQDSLPFVPTEVEVEIITNTPKIAIEEINRVKDELRNYTERINNGDASFATLARLYSEDPGSARNGGEMDYAGKATFVPEFATVAFNLTDPNKVSKIVETEFGFHIIQLIDKRGDKIKVRHILRKPKVSQEEIDKAIVRLDSIGDDIRAGKYTFESATVFVSDDKETKNNHGLMAFNDQENMSRTSKFRMQDLPTEIARVVETMQVGDVSRSFQMVDNRGKTVCAIVKLKTRIEGHRATITEDFQTMKNVVMAKRREEVLHNWVKNKLKTTYVKMNERYKDCNFEYQGWIK